MDPDPVGFALFDVVLRPFTAAADVVVVFLLLQFENKCLNAIKSEMKVYEARGKRPPMLDQVRDSVVALPLCQGMYGKSLKIFLLF